MSIEDNKALVRRAIEEVWNQGNVALIDELDDANLVHHDPDFPNIRTREDYKQWVIETRNAFPDLHLISAWFLSQGSLDSTLPWQVGAEKWRPASFTGWMEPSTFKRLRFISVVQGHTQSEDVSVSCFTTG